MYTIIEKNTIFVTYLIHDISTTYFCSDRIDLVLSFKRCFLIMSVNGINYCSYHMDSLVKLTLP